MQTAFVLMTAMPPTTGHLQLVQFASELAPHVTVILNTQPFEPFPDERAAAMREAIQRSGLHNVKLIHYKKAIEQDPGAPGFWPMWRQMMTNFGCKKGDIIVASETYGRQLAGLMEAEFYPYDIERVINQVKATPVRLSPLTHFTDMLPEFQKYLQVRVTIFGAESTGKTTLSKKLAKKLNAVWLFEYARPYLENTVNEITVRSMTAIWWGQKALQQHAYHHLQNTPFIIQDTDLFSTVGYWQFPHWQTTIGACPDGLMKDAQDLKSDIYVITKSNIPFEADPLRYGGDVREGSDEYWIRVCEQQQLPYVVLEESNFDARLKTAEKIIKRVARQRMTKLWYDRKGL
jgi:NadR type nicotinamide-nucleotide adenylyltransferase